MLPFMQIQPPRADGKFDRKLLNDPMWFAEEKYDGDRRIAQINPYDGPIGRGELFPGCMARFTGRTVSEVDGLMVEKTANLPHLNGCAIADLKDIPKSLAGTVLDGEMVCADPLARSKDVTSIMGSKPAEAIRKQEERGWLQYMVFDCLWFKGEDIRKQPLAIRRKKAAEAVAEWNNPNVLLAEAFTEDIEKRLGEIWDRDGEGIILKRIDQQYGNEKLWVKVKQVNTADVVIMGYKAAKSVSTKSSGVTSATKYAAMGLIGAIRCGMYKDGVLTECASISGFNDKLRNQISKDPESFLNQVVQIKYQLREEDTGHFRHPRFDKFRKDKMASQCLWENQP